MNNRRVCFVEVETNDNGKQQMKRLDGLAIKGTIHREAGSVSSEAKIQIANLTKSDLTYLTTYTSPYVKPKTKKKISIYAGYENTGWGRIFTGDIVQAIPDGMPDVWLNIDAKSLYYNNRVPISYGVQNITTQELGQSIADQLGLSFDWQASSTKTIDIFNLSGSKTELLREYNKLDNILMFEDNGKIKVVDKTPQNPQQNNNTANNNSNKNKVRVLSKDTGMIGRPEPDQFGVKVKALIDPAWNCGDWFNLQSAILTDLNGYYWIYTMDYTFASREPEFYVELYGKAQGVQ